ncbi:MAG: hypothetical protein OEY23_07145 [Acidimicrobiia bacterium]|nr:hypothetical protein [Acidimicrobiia bacterium]MDH4352687.1 hypothetical protein [Actinomycetota bacterium]
MGASSSRDVVVLGAGRAPANATAVVLNVTVTDVQNPTHIAVLPSTGSPVTFSSTSNVNATTGQIVANLVTVRPGANGAVTIFNNQGPANVVVDLIGSYTPPGAQPLRYASVVTNATQSGRVLDTRPGGTLGDVERLYKLSVDGAPCPVLPPVAPPPADCTVPLGPGATMTVDNGGGGQAVVVNVTALNASTSTYLTVYNGATRPGTSTLNVVPGEIVSNQVVVYLDTADNNNADKFKIYNHAGTVDVVVDYIGAFQPPQANQSVRYEVVMGDAPTRIYDSRNFAARLSGGDYGVQVRGVGGVPDTANVKGVILNLTAVAMSGPGYIRLTPTPSSTAAFSHVNFRQWETRANQVIVQLGPTGAINANVYAAGGSGDMVVDVLGWLVEPAG